MLRRLANRFRAHASIAGSSLGLQVATYFLLFAFKGALTDVEYVVAMAQIAIFSIVGSVASLRLEMLLFQERGGIDRRGVVVPLLVAVAILALAYAGLKGLAAVWPGQMPVAAAALPLGLAFALQDIQNFLCVQTARWRDLLTTRLAQAGLLVAVSLIGGMGGQITSGTALVLAYGLALLVPSLLWMARFGRGLPHEPLANPALNWPRLLRRSLPMTLSQLINSAYVNLAGLIAIAQLPAAQAADFNFIARLATGPVTLIRQVSGQLFLARALQLDQIGKATAPRIHAMMAAVAVKSTLAYLAAAVLIAGFLFVAHDAAQISHPEMLVPLLFAAGAQCVAGQLTLIRVVLRDEFAFMLAEVARITAMLAILLSFVAIPYHWRLGIGSGLIYLGYCAFVWLRTGQLLPRWRKAAA